MRPFPVLLGTAALFGSVAEGQELSYEDSIHVLAYGNFASSPNESSGDIWLNVTGFALDQLPHIQHDLGITSLDNAQELQVIAGLAQTAASNGLWGDLVFLYNVFAMNAHAGSISVSTPQMQAGLLEAVGGGPQRAGLDEKLVDLHASTSSSTDLRDAFKGLLEHLRQQQNQPVPSSSALAERLDKR